MLWPLLLMSSLSAALVGLVTWAAARRYGRRRALLIPVLALVSVVYLMWRTMGQGGPHGMAQAAYFVAVAGPGVAGALAGLVLSGRRRG